MTQMVKSGTPMKLSLEDYSFDCAVDPDSELANFEYEFGSTVHIIVDQERLLL